MCKIVAFTDLKKMKLKNHINNIGNTLLKSEQDGFGYAVQGKAGVFGEKTINKTFRSRMNAKHVLQFPFIKPTCETFGKYSELVGPGIFHGRTSTNSDGLINTHPMQRDDWNLIHNGVVDDYGPDYTLFTDNDSEHVLARLIEGIKSVETNLEGYYAFAAIDPKGRLHICRDRYATLYAAYSKAYDSFVFATTESLLLKLNKMLNAQLGPIDEVEDNVYIIFNGNNVEHYQSIEPCGVSVKQTVYSERSLGKELANLGGSEHWNNGAWIGPTKSVVLPSSETKISESDWHKDDTQWNETLSSIASQTHDRSEHWSEFNQDSYYQWRHEVDNMDAAYEIYDENDIKISLIDFKKLTHTVQEMCRIVRPDGTPLTLDDERKLGAV